MVDTTTKRVPQSVIWTKENSSRKSQAEDVCMFLYFNCIPLFVAYFVLQILYIFCFENAIHRDGSEKFIIKTFAKIYIFLEILKRWFKSFNKIVTLLNNSQYLFVFRFLNQLIVHIYIFFFFCNRQVVNFCLGKFPL